VRRWRVARVTNLIRPYGGAAEGTSWVRIDHAGYIRHSYDHLHGFVTSCVPAIVYPLLAGHTVGSPRGGVEALCRDWRLALGAYSELTSIKASQGGIDQLQLAPVRPVLAQSHKLLVHQSA
jgi:hypothetical protein